MQTLRNPLNIFRAKSPKRSSSSTVSQPEKKSAGNSNNGGHVASRNSKTTTHQQQKPLPDVKKKTSTQKLFVKRDKHASECLAETKIEKKSICREKTQKSIVLAKPACFACEKIEKTIKASNEIHHQPGPSSSQKTERSSTVFCTEQMIDEIFAPLRERLEEISGIRHSSSSPEKMKSINHTPSSRLELWKAQLNSPRGRDNSAPAPVQRLTIKPQNTHLNIPPAPRPIHSTQSANNALSFMDHRTLKDANIRNRCGTWQPLSLNTYKTDRPIIDFVTSPRLSTNESNIFKPIAHRAKPAEILNHNDNNKKSFRRVESHARSDSKNSNFSLSDLLLMYQAKDCGRDMNASLRSTASNSSSFRSFPPEQSNQHKRGGLTTLSSSSSGIHVTPSPSDSGIIDYENLIRDKEIELQEIRSTMEQNEEIIIKVYQDKERAWQTELEGLKGRVSAAEKGEKALREQLTNCQRQNAAMGSCMRTMQEEKTKLMAKCIQLEREIEHLRKNNYCTNCSKSSKHTEDSNLRREVQDLRREVANLKKVVDIHHKT